MKRSGVFPFLVSLAVFLVLETASLRFLSSNGELQKVWLARRSHAFMGSVWGLSENVREYLGLRKENKALQEENFMLQTQLLKAREQLRAQKAAAEDHWEGDFEYHGAEVLKLSRGKQHNYFILNRGHADGIKEKSGVYTPLGIVGIVDAVSEHRSFAFSFQNSGISVSSRIGHYGTAGPLMWDGRTRDGAVLDEIPLQYPINPGDTVYTSGHSLIFPPDLPLGEVVSTKIVNGTAQQARVRLFQDFSTVRFVSVAHNIAFDYEEEVL